jgi:hypothetical protein
MGSLDEADFALSKDGREHGAEVVPLGNHLSFRRRRLEVSAEFERSEID